MSDVPFVFRFRAMGSPCQLRLYAEDETHARACAHRLRAEAERLEQCYSRYRPDSLLSRINATAGSGEVMTVDGETAALLDYADTCYRQSGGLFDITSGVWRRCWDFKDFSKAPRLPDACELAALAPLVGWDKVDWQRPRIRLPAGMEIDLGGLVKEYAADSLATLAGRQDIEHGLIELGGDIRVIGPHPDGRPWRLGISHPCRPDEAVATIALAAGALATSGTYERCFELEGRLYHHILDPRSGWPVRCLLSVSVIAQHCLVAGSAATIALLRENDAQPWLRELGLPWLTVDQGGAVTNGLGADTPPRAFSRSAIIPG